MFSILKRWFFGGEKNKAPELPLAVGYARLADIPKDTPRDLSEKNLQAIVCAGDQMTLHSRNSLPERLCSGELCWLLPAGDIPLCVEFLLEDVPLAISLKIRFEPDHTFAAFVAQRESLSEEDLKTVILGEFLSLVELKALTVAQLVPGDSEAYAKLRLNRLRADFSLLLQPLGMRCTGIDDIRKITGSAKTASEKLPEEARAEIRQSLAAVKTDTGWEAFMQQLGDAGAIPNEEAAENLELLGTALVAQEQSAELVAVKIEEIVEGNAVRNMSGRQNAANWSALQTRMRWLDAVSKGESAGETENLPAGSEIMRKRLPKKLGTPSTWYFFRRASADEKLQSFLRESFVEMQGMLTAARNRLPGFSEKAKLEKSTMMLANLRKKMEIMPDIHAPTWRLRSRQRNSAELLKAIRRAVTGTQMIFGIFRDLSCGDLNPENFDVKILELETLLTLLDADIRNRRDIYGVS